MEPGKRSTPLHMELAEEEIFYVLGGSGLSWQWLGEEQLVYEVSEGDCLVHLAGEEAHTLVAGADGLDVLAFGTRVWPGGTWLPRAGVIRVPPTWVEAPGGARPWEREAAAGAEELPEPGERPERIVNVRDVEARRIEEGSSVFVERDLGVAAGSRWTGLAHQTIDPGKRNWPFHSHSAEEEIFVVLEGEGVLRLGAEEHHVRPGNVLARPPGTGVAHTFHAGDSGLVLLAYGTRDPRDVAFLPDSQKLFFRGAGIVTRVEPLDYWEGEA